MGQVEPVDLGLRPSPQGEEGPPSLEYIQAKDLFPPKELVKEEENLQVRRNWGPRMGGAPCPVNTPYSNTNISKGTYPGLPLPGLWREGSLSACALWILWLQGRKGSFLVQLLPGAVTMERTLLCALPQHFQRGSHIKGEGNGGMTHFWTEGSSAPWQVPFTVLQGEGVEFLGRAADALIAISNYRLHIKFKDSVINVSSCHVLPHSSQDPSEVQGGIAPVLYHISNNLAFPFLTFCFPPLFS